METVENKSLIDTENKLELATRALANIELAEEKEVVSPIRRVESSIANFLEKAIGVTIESNRFSKAIEDSLIAGLPEMKNDEKIALYNIERTSSNDRLYKLLAPTINMIAAKQQAEIQAQAKRDAQQSAVQVNIGAGNGLDSNIASKVSADVSIGLNALFQLAEAKKRQLAEEAAAEKNSSTESTEEVENPADNV